MTTPADLLEAIRAAMIRTAYQAASTGSDASAQLRALAALTSEAWLAGLLKEANGQAQQHTEGEAEEAGAAGDNQDDPDYLDRRRWQLPEGAAVRQARPGPPDLASVSDSTSPVFRAVIGGKPYFVKHLKGRQHKLRTADTGRAEEVVSDLAHLAGVAVPHARVVQYRGRPTLVAPWVEGRDLGQASSAEVARVPAEDWAAHTLFGYLADLDDRHAANYRITPEGRLVSIDHELSLGAGAPWGYLGARRSDEAAVARLKHAPLARHAGGLDMPLPDAVVGRLLAAVPRMYRALRQRGLDRQARHLQHRAKRLAQLREQGGRTLGDLVAMLEGVQQHDEYAEAA